MQNSGYFRTENYTWKFGIVQNLCEYCQFFLYVLLDQICAVDDDDDDDKLFLWNCWPTEYV